MLVKFETKSQRVKGLSFHFNRPWILASLHSGEIQLWDYRVGTLIDKYEEHEGPVRGISFHPNQPLFVSGGDDANIFGWNYKNKKKIFALKGHLDYIRTVFFHHELPWVLSTSDDQTIRIWNYLSRNQLAIMTGHTNLVMCAQFHPSKELIVSCSLDQTVKLWDYSNLLKKHTSSGSSKPSEGGYTGTEVELKAILEGHDRGINWCAFHPTTNLILSAADDRKVKLWKYNENTGKAWEHDSLYGHSNNVCSAVFHDKLDIIISDSEDRSIKVWDLNKRVCIDTFKKDADRYWVLALHPELNYIAAGSDSGLTVFTLQSERVPYVLANNQNDLFFVNKKQLVHRDMKSGRETVITNIDHNPSNSSLRFQKPSAIHYNNFNNANHNVIVHFKDSEKNYEKYYSYTFSTNVERGKDHVDSTHRFCHAATFVGKDKLAVLTHASGAKEVGLAEPNGSVRPLPNLPPIDMIYPANINKVILRSEYNVMLYDASTRKIINQIEHNDIAKLKHVVWNSKFSYVALICGKTIFLLNKNFNLVGTVEEKFKVLSAAWNNDDVLVYTTKNHLKYSILNGDNGILKCLEAPIYLLSVKDNEALTIDRDMKIQSLLFDREEYLFKASIYYKDAKRIKFLMENHKQLGNSIISYLYKKNYPAIALNMVKDTRARFSLALDSGNLEVAFRACHDQLKDKDCYAKLGEEALRQGNHQIVEIAYQNTRIYEKLSFLYLITGNLFKLEKMSQVAQKRGDVMGRFQNSLYLGDVYERIRILAEAGLIHLAYLTAVTHNISEMVEPLYESIKDSLPSLDITEKSEALIPPKPLILDPKSTEVALCNWPHHQLHEEDILLSRETQEAEEQQHETAAQELELNLDSRGYEEAAPAVTDYNPATDLAEPLDSAWGDVDIIDIPDVEVPSASKTQDTYSNIADSAPGKDPVVEKAKNSQLAGELVSIGEFESAALLLKKQIGVTNVDPLVPIFNKIYKSSQVKISGLPFTNPVSIQLSEDGKRPYVLGSISQLGGLLRVAYRFTTEGKFAEALEAFKNVLLHVPLLVLKQSQEEEDVYSLIRICYHYILAMRCELGKKQVANNPVRCLELSTYMACCSLQPAHRILTLRSAMALAFKMQDFVYAAHFARKIIQLGETNANVTKPEVIDNAKKVYAACEQKGTNQHSIEFEASWLNDDDFVTNRICAKSLRVLKASEVKRDPFVKAAYSAEYDGQLDDISGVCKIGMECLGFKIH